MPSHHSFQPLDHPPTLWTPLPPNSVKVNVDASFKHPTIAASTSAIKRNNFGEVIFGSISFCKTSSQSAEALTISKVVHLAKLVFNGPMCLESNITRFVDAIPCSSSVLDWQTASMVEDIYATVPHIHPIGINFVSRSSNKAVNWLTASYRKGVCALNWVFAPPPLLLFILLHDCTIHPH